MLKSTIVWAVAALLAAPAVPMFATTTTHHRLVAPALAHRAIAKVSKRHHVVRATHRRATSLTHRKLSSHRLTAKHRIATKTAVRHTSINSGPHFRVHVTKMPPTIDGIQA